MLTCHQAVHEGSHIDNVFGVIQGPPSLAVPRNYTLTATSIYSVLPKPDPCKQK
jgi:hypothetical protein